MFFSGDEAVSNLRTYVEDGNISLLLTSEGVADTTALLQRVFKANVNGTGTMSYKMWIKILELSLRMEDYTEFCKNATGYRTLMKVWADELADIWKTISLNK
jgi:hypothetical protein